MKRSLIEQLAPYEPMNQDEQGGCVFCGGQPPGERYGYSGRFLTDHEKGCAWVKARRALGDRLCASREALYFFLRDQFQHLKGDLSSVPKAQRILLAEALAQGWAEPTAQGWRLSEAGQAWLRSAQGLVLPVAQALAPGRALVDLGGVLTEVTLGGPLTVVAGQRVWLGRPAHDGSLQGRPL